jgi:hypothetical protein
MSGALRGDQNSDLGGNFEFEEMGSAIADAMGAKRCDCNIMRFHSASSSCHLLWARRCRIEDDDGRRRRVFRGDNGVGRRFDLLGHRPGSACRSDKGQS